MPTASPVATKIMIIRHAEKPLTDTAPFGVAADGTQGKHMLLVRGWTRAGALATLLAPERGPLQSPALARPEHLFACKVEVAGSHRPHDTIAPLSAVLNVAIDDRFGQDDVGPLITEAMGRTGVVLICWEHKRIHKITASIPRHHQEPPDRFHWPGERFDAVFVFDLDGDKYRFSQVPQMLLDGDSESPIDVHATPVDLDDDD